jgi:hypothetical protein
MSRLHRQPAWAPARSYQGADDALPPSPRRPTTHNTRTRPCAAASRRLGTLPPASSEAILRACSTHTHTHTHTHAARRAVSAAQGATRACMLQRRRAKAPGRHPARALLAPGRVPTPHTLDTRTHKIAHDVGRGPARGGVGVVQAHRVGGRHHLHHVLWCDQQRAEVWAASPRARVRVRCVRAGGGRW